MSQTKLKYFFHKIAPFSALNWKIWYNKWLCISSTEDALHLPCTQFLFKVNSTPESMKLHSTSQSDVRLHQMVTVGLVSEAETRNACASWWYNAWLISTQVWIQYVPPFSSYLSCLSLVLSFNAFKLFSKAGDKLSIIIFIMAIKVMQNYLKCNYFNIEQNTYAP